MKKKHIPRCHYCSTDEKKVESELVTADKIYTHRPDLWDKFFYMCRSCGAYVGCHEGTENPLGRLANAELRLWKRNAHAAFDPMWKAKLARENCSKSEARNTGYKWLAGEMGITVKRCHIGKMSLDECKQVVEICSKYLR